MDEFGLISSLAITLGAVLLGELLARALKQSPIVGHLIAGIIIGPYVLRIISEPEIIRILASIGVVLLLFTLGLKFSFSAMAKVKKVALFGGIAQIVISTLAGILVSFLFDWNIQERLIFGVVIAFSSTMMVIAMLNHRGELETIHGRILIGVLLVQDLAVTFAMFLFPALKNLQTNLLPQILLVLLQAMLFVGLIIFLGVFLVPRFLKGIASRASRELIVIAGAALCFGGAFLAYHFGLSAAIGAFAIGLVLSQSDFTHQILGEMAPIRDIFSALFFASMGMLIDLPWIWKNWPFVLLVVVLIVGAKFLIFSTIVKSFRYQGKTVLLSGAGIISVGEFSFVLAELGRSQGLLSLQSYSMILALATFSLVLAPIIFGISYSIYQRFSSKRGFAPESEETLCSSVAKILVMWCSQDADEWETK